MKRRTLKSYVLWSVILLAILYAIYYAITELSVPFPLIIIILVGLGFSDIQIRTPFKKFDESIEKNSKFRK